MKYLWSATDQRNLEELLARKAGFDEQSLQPLLVVMGKVGLKPFLSQEMIDHADELRDALAPFDSGDRPMSEGP